MNKNNKNNAPFNDVDATGEVISWVVVFILLVAFWPVGLLLLVRKMSGYAKPNKNSNRQTGTQASGAARKNASQTTSADWQATVTAQQAASQASAAARQAASHASVATQNAAKQAATAARQAASQATEAAREASNSARQAVSGTHSNYSYNYSYAPKTNAKKKQKNRSALEKKTGKFISVMMLLISIPMLIIAASGIASATQNIIGNGASDWYGLIMGLFFFIGGLIMLFTRNIGVKRIARFKNYYSYVAGHDIVRIDDIALAAGQSTKAVIRDLQSMINNGYFDPGAYIDRELNSLVFSAAAAKEARRAARDTVRPAAEVTPPGEKPENQYMAIILQLRDLNDTIIDVPISDKIDRIEELTSKIFRIVEENPEKLPETRRFMNYYLPTTLKLLHSYATLEKQGVKGENISAAKENISRILETLATGYEQQLDQLFKSDAIDIAADINVLENMMQQDGLTGDRAEFKTMESGW